MEVQKAHWTSIRARKSTLTNRHDVGDRRAICWVKAWEQGYGTATSILSNWIELILVLK